MSVLQTIDLKKYYGTEPNITRALDGVNFSVKDGEFVAVVGTSGSGKSTLLHMMGGLDTPTSGTVIVRGEELAKKNDEQLTIFRRRNIGFMPMCIVWEEKSMNRMFAVSKYEYKMQIKRIAGWLVLLFVLVSAMMDSLPTTENLKRIEFLYDIHYYVRRVFSFDGLILLFALMFLMAGRLVSDRKTGRRDLFMAAPIGKGSYIGGKLMGNFLYDPQDEPL